MAILSYSLPPTVEIRDSRLNIHGVRLSVRREDLNHPAASGNKWWKLKYNLEEAQQQGKRSVLTFGGAFSNHLYATASAAREVGLESIGIVRGEPVLPLNPVLAFACSQGMKLKYISREQYREKTKPGFLCTLAKEFGDPLVIPEGGTNPLAIKGCEELGKIILKEHEFDYLALPVGTGGTMAGLIAALSGARRIIGFSSLKGGEFLTDDVNGMLEEFGSPRFDNWRIETSYHFGGYAKATASLSAFMDEMKALGIPLDRVYTSKMLYGVYDLIQKKIIKGPSAVLVLHTGGLHGSTE